MSEGDGNELEHRVLILAPTGKDAELTQAILGKVGIATLICSNAERMVHEAAAGTGCVLVAEEALTEPMRSVLADLLARQAPWADLPLLILTRPGAHSAAMTAATDDLGNVTLLERPLRVATLVSAVRSALRARDRQYQLRDRFEIQALLASIIESSSDAIISKTLDGVILSWNAGAERIFGYSAAEAIGRPITLIIPPERHDEERMILDRLRRGERIEHFDTVRVSKVGKPIDISLTISPIRNADNRIVGASKIARDITDRKRVEQALRDADRRKDEFLATLAHELRNPLAPIRNSIHILRLAGGSDPAVQQVREMMERQVNHMVRLVDDLMEVSRITRGKLELRKERVELASVIRAAVETSQPLIESAGHQLAVAIPPEPLTLDADPVRLAQVISNLLNNAAKYTKGAAQIWLTVRREDGEVVVSVRDTGIGISADMLPCVFEMFTQIADTHRRSQGGLGIGLTLVRSLVQMHGGQVTASSPGLGKGSEFVVRLPLASGELADAAPAPKKPAALVPHRVLVVDDNRDAADSLGVLLKCLGAEVEVVHDGPAALQALETFQPAAVLLDIGMPGMDGYEVARRIRQQPAFQDLTIIAMTGWGQESDRRRSHAAGFNHHLIKPANIDALRAVMAITRGADVRHVKRIEE
jgi:PAS domain S-box-containing protein